MPDFMKRLNRQIWAGFVLSLFAIEVDLLVDGEAVAWAALFCNAPSQHMALVSVPMPYTLSIGEHTFTLQAGNSETVSDFNDFFYVTLLY
jgi:hypothetical protein